MIQLPSTIVQALLTLRLTKKHIAVVTALYSFGRLRISEIAAKLNDVKRTEVYSLIDSLIKEKLVKKISVNNVMHCELTCREEMLLWVRRIHDDLFRQYHDSAVALKELTDFFRNHAPITLSEPEHVYFEGEDGLKEAHRFLKERCASSKVRIYIHAEASHMFSKSCKDMTQCAHQLFSSDSEVIIVNSEDLLKQDFCKKLYVGIPVHDIKSSYDVSEHTRSYFKGHVLTYLSEDWMLDFGFDHGRLRGLFMYRDESLIGKAMSANFDMMWRQCLEKFCVK